MSAMEVLLALQRAADAAARPSPVKVVDLVESWAALPGHPVLTVTRDFDKRTATLRQVSKAFISRLHARPAFWREHALTLA